MATKAKSAQETPVHLNALPLGETMFETSIPDPGGPVIGEKAISCTNNGRLGRTGNSTPRVVDLVQMV